MLISFSVRCVSSTVTFMMHVAATGTWTHASRGEDLNVQCTSIALQVCLQAFFGLTLQGCLQ